MNLKQVFNLVDNLTKTENNDEAYKSSNNKYVDIIFKVMEYRKKNRYNSKKHFR